MNEEQSYIMDLHKRLYYQASHRGTKEADLLLEAFTKKYLVQFNLTNLFEFERLLQLNDYDIINWRFGYTPLPPEYDGPVMRLLLEFDITKSLRADSA